MSPKQAALNPDIKRLFDEGYEVEVRNGYLVIHSVPYVNSDRQVKTGAVVTDLNINVDELLPQKDHQVWFVGDYPCHSTGAPIEAIRNVSNSQQLWEGFEVQHRFSCKINGQIYPDYYSKMKNYINIISNEAVVINPTATASTFKVIDSVEEESVFRYHDSASSRADILAISAKLTMHKVAIIGLGGTGSYVLDLIAKTPIKEIHLFDGDIFLQHNAFRAPGAASVDALKAKLPKVEYYLRIYDAMRRGIVPHAEYLTAENMEKLVGFDFVFICIDKGPVRKLISTFLQEHNIPFIDVGMDLMMGPEAQNLLGTCRVTMSTPNKSDHFQKHVPMTEDLSDDLYRKNIQVADMNALNAALAVNMWKKYCGFYQDLYQVHHTTYSINSQSLTRDEMVGVPAE
ncbi:MAG: ThiF family adenylyltransferase [Methylophilus sp.]